MLIQYRNWNPREKTLAVVRQANEILDEYADQGYELSLRQLYYQFVARDLIANTERSYKNLGSIISDSRDAGLISWDMIKDRGRSLYGHTCYADGESYIHSMASQFYCDFWEGQDTRVQVWVEKEALANIVGRACGKWDVDYFPCKGYMSASAIWEMGRHMVNIGGRWLLLHLGDHDPSGIDMSRDIDNRLNTYSSPIQDEERPEIEVRRIALNMDQVEEYGPPPNPAKVTDSRFETYADRYGDESWELDALEPATITELIDGHIREAISDMTLFDERREFQSRTRERLSDIVFEED